MTRLEDAHREKDRLESAWISLLSWLAESRKSSIEHLVSSYSPSLAAGDARTRFLAAERKSPNVEWNLLSFVDLQPLYEIGRFYKSDLDKLGQPPRKWVGVLGDHFNRGLASYRNHLSHGGGRFAFLPIAEQDVAIALMREQYKCLREWWPGVPPGTYAPSPPEDPMRVAIKLLGPDPTTAEALVEQLGLKWQPGLTNHCNKDLEPQFDGLFRLGEATFGANTNVALFFASVRNWPLRSAERERFRRKVAKVTTARFGKDRRQIILMIDAQGKADEAEIVVPRTRAGSGFGTVRASIKVHDPSRHHVDTLKGLKIAPGMNLANVSKKWNEALAVETVTKRFYEEFQGLRERMIIELLKHNPTNLALVDATGKLKDREKDKDFAADLNAFATRQLCRILFLWFIQQKRWLGGSPGVGETDFLLKVFGEFKGEDSFFADALLPICFIGIGRKPSERKNWLGSAPTKLSDELREKLRDRLKELPPLGGGLFTPGIDAFEERLFGVDSDSGEVTVRVNLPDDLFDPAKDDNSGAMKNRVRTVLGLLASYRFTTQESTPDDQSLDPDPELLGKVFENLYQAKDRKDTGAYYTPREIVQYMCRQTLDAYLRDRAGADQDTIDLLRNEALDWTYSKSKLTAEQEDALSQALDDVRIIDPAVGSGAFLLMMMHEIVTLRRGIKQAAEDKQLALSSSEVAFWKRQVAENNLFGVDINPMAVEICQLRLWLSVVVDLDVRSFGQIEPLPDLELKIVAGDSLIDRAGEDRFLESLPQPTDKQLTLTPQYVPAADGTTPKGKRDNETAHERLNGLIARYRNEKGPVTQRKLRGQVRDLKVDMMVAQLDHMMKERAAVIHDVRNPHFTKRPRKSTMAAKEGQMAAFVDMKESLLRRKKDKTGVQKPFLWPLNFLDVFERKNGGFDIVVANPPYVKAGGIAKADKAIFAEAFPEVYGGTADLFVYFYARAIQVLRPGGQLAFITSNSFVKRSYGKKLQEFLGKTLSLHHVIDFGETAVFDATVEPYVLAATNTPSQDGHMMEGHFLFVEIARAIGGRGSVAAVREKLNDLQHLLEADCVRTPQSTFTENEWRIEPPEIIVLYNRLMARGAPLGEFVQGRMYSGIKTGLTDAFVIDESTRSALIAQDNSSAELIKPWLRGRDVRMWTAKSAGLYCIHAPWQLEISKYPAIEAHLKKLKPKLAERPEVKRGIHKWWTMSRWGAGYHKEFEVPKIIWPEFARSVRFAADDSRAYLNNKCFFWADPPAWALAVLNSTLIEFLLCVTTGQIRGSFMQLYDYFVKQLPIVEPGVEEATLVALVQQMIDNPAADKGKDIELVVRALYGLDAEESKVIDAWFSRRSLSAVPDDIDGDDDDE